MDVTAKWKVALSKTPPCKFNGCHLGCDFDKVVKSLATHTKLHASKSAPAQHRTHRRHAVKRDNDSKDCSLRLVVLPCTDLSDFNAQTCRILVVYERRIAKPCENVPAPLNSLLVRVISTISCADLFLANRTPEH